MYSGVVKNASVAIAGQKLPWCEKLEPISIDLAA